MNLPKFSPSSFSTYNDCPQKWEYTYIDGLVTVGVQAKHFDIGLYAHENMHHLYRAVKDGMKPGSEHLQAYLSNKIRRDVNFSLTTENAKTISVVVKIMTDYVFRQMAQIDQKIRRIEGVEMTVSKEFTTPLGHRIILEGIADLVYTTSTGGIIVRDHKTGTRNSYSDQRLQLNLQLLFYAVVLRALGYTVDGVEISYLNSTDYKDRSKEPFNKLFSVARYSPSNKVLDSILGYCLNRVDTILTVEPQPVYGQQCNSCPFSGICRLKLNEQPTVNFIAGQYDRRQRSYRIPVLWREQPEISNEHSNGLVEDSTSFDFDFEWSDDSD